jgi:hypothetical protein
MCEKETMFSILTYEPFEKITGDEKKYIEAVLNDDLKGQQGYPLYDELMKAFKVCKNTKDSTALAQWYEKHYTTKAVGKIKVLWSKDKDERTYYPVLFKKICYYCLTECNLQAKDFLNHFNIKDNIIRKWGISPMYGKLAKKDTYSYIPILRNGKKQKYLTKVIKATFYEASRQAKSNGKCSTMKKKDLLKFVDVFAGTGTVSASVDANETYVNDKELGAACFLYSMSNDEMQVRTRLAELHNGIISNYYKGGKLYTKKHWEKDKQKTDKYKSINDESFDELIIRLRNNYRSMHETYKKYVKRTFNYLIREENEEMLYDIGIVWFFLKSLPQNSYSGNKFKFSDMDIDNYYSYLKLRLEVVISNNGSNTDLDSLLGKYGNKKHELIKNLELKAEDIEFSKGKKFISGFKKVEVKKEDFKKFLDSVIDSDDYFVYLDSPYFLTTQYDVGFYDKEHKKMLDILRKATYSWLFSMQYYEGSTKEVKKVRRPTLKEYSRQIKDYDAYYKGFVGNFKKNDEGYLVVENITNRKKLDELYVILFNYVRKNKTVNTKLREMMICNFDVRPAIKYGSNEVILPMREFLKLESQKGKKYSTIYKHAVKWRQRQIKKKFGSCEIL